MTLSKKKGFSIIEILVSISILTLITASAVTNFREGERKSQLNIAADGLVSNIRKAQSMVLNGSKFGSAEMPYNGYGIYFETNQYLIFADNNSNMVYDAGEEIDKFKFDNITLSIPSDAGGDFNNLLFTPPKAWACVNINGCAPCDCNLKNAGKYSITLTHNTTGDSINIFLNQLSGRVDKE